MGGKHSRIDHFFHEVGKDIVKVGKDIEVPAIAAINSALGDLPILSCGAAIGEGIEASKTHGSERKWAIAGTVLEGASCLSGG